jgi:hypothetical protein
MGEDNIIEMKTAKKKLRKEPIRQVYEENMYIVSGTLVLRLLKLVKFILQKQILKTDDDEAAFVGYVAALADAVTKEKFEEYKP